jgi:hypothetical protein
MVVKDEKGRKKKSAAKAQERGKRGVTAQKHRWYATGQMALHCGVSVQTIRNDIDRGKINANKSISGRFIIPRSEVDRYMLENGYGTEVKQSGM